MDSDIRLPGGFRIGFEGLIGLVVPVIGDRFDFVFKANMRNVQLIETYLSQAGATRRHSRWLVAPAPPEMQWWHWYQHPAC